MDIHTLETRPARAQASSKRHRFRCIDLRVTFVSFFWSRPGIQKLARAAQPTGRQETGPRSPERIWLKDKNIF